MGTQLDSAGRRDGGDAARRDRSERPGTDASAGARGNRFANLVALPPGGRMGAYWRVIKSAGATLVVLADDPKSILGRIVFYDADSRPVHRELSPEQRLRYLREIESDITCFRRSYMRAHLKVHIGGLAVPEVVA